MAKGPSEISQELLDVRSHRRKARGRVEWGDLEFTEVSHGYRRKLTIRHVPTGISAEAEGFHAGRRELKDQILPVLIRAVLRHKPERSTEATVRDATGGELPDEPEGESGPDGPPR